MNVTSSFLKGMLDMDLQAATGDIVWRAGRPTGAAARGGMVYLTVPFYVPVNGTEAEDGAYPRRCETVVVRAYGDEVVRLSFAPQDGELPGDDSVMLAWHASLQPEALSVRALAQGWELVDTRGTVRMTIDAAVPVVEKWGEYDQGTPESFCATVYPDGLTAVPFLAIDGFAYWCEVNSLPLAYVERDGAPHRTAFSLYAKPGEKFAGTGERFAQMNLAGRTLALENTDGLGVNNRRTYKNIPFYYSSAGYGLLALTPAHLRLSLADISTRAAQGMVEANTLDLFFIGGGTPDRILYNYRRITGFPADMPLWSYGTWMSRMTYFSAEETLDIARQMREGGFPCDVIHLDTGWFAKDWVCEWAFSPERFPDPADYARRMQEMGYQVTLWQTPAVAKDSLHYETAKTHGYIAPRLTGEREGSNFSEVSYGGAIDFSNPAAVDWYKGLLARLLQMGFAAIKTDFGEDIDMDAQYFGMPADKLHNLYALLYQKAAFEITQEVTGQGIIWARSSWVGSQRYPLHWGGDSACSWDGLAGDIRGGLHFGLSGFAFWSHDVPGFYGIPNFMNTLPPDDLYVRWTQVGVLSSHLRYHGAQPREPYLYPAIADVVRQWLRLRYSLIPYLQQQGTAATQSGAPVFRALVFHHPDDPACWSIDDQFYCGDHLLVAPILNAEGVRDVYLPEGRWTDLWTGVVTTGPALLRDVTMPLSRIPIYATTGAMIPVYPEVVQHTGEMDCSRVVPLHFDGTYTGLADSVLGTIIEL